MKTLEQVAEGEAVSEETKRHASGKTDFELAEEAIDVAVNGDDIHEAGCEQDDACRCPGAVAINDGHAALVRMDRERDSLREQVRALTERAEALGDLEKERKRAVAWHETMADLAALADPASKLGDYATVRDVLLRRTSTESALATLRTALEFIAAWDPETFPRVPDEKNPEKTYSYGFAYGSNGERDFMRDVARKALDATPSEHPDTATLRTIRTLARDREWLGRTVWEAIRRDHPNRPEFKPWGERDEALREECRRRGEFIASRLLGDSGPSGGGEEMCQCDHPHDGRPCEP